MDIPIFADMPKGNVNEFEEQRKLLKAGRFIPGSKITPPDAILRLKDVTICTPENICNIQGPAKSAKSSVMGAAIAAMLRAITGKPECLEETLGFTSHLKRNSDKLHQHILHFDTEQSSYHHHKLGMSVLDRAGVKPAEYEDLPFHSYSLISIYLPYRKRMIQRLIGEIESQGADHKVVCVVIDGIADIINDPNDGPASNELVSWLHALARDHQFAVITIVHENPGDTGKARGHLGSQILRKTETNLRVRKGGSTGKDGAKSQDHGISTIWVERARGAHIPESEGIKIRWCDRKNRHMPYDPSKHARKPEGEKNVAAPPQSSALTPQQERIKAWLSKTLAAPRPHKELVELIEKKEKCAERTAKARIKQWVKQQWIHKQTGSMAAPYALGPAPVEETQTS